MTYDFNILVSHEWADYYAARQEIRSLLKEFGDPTPEIKRTAARGLAGVKTILESRRVIALLSQKYAIDVVAINYTLKWIPVDLWRDSTSIESIKQALGTLTDRILPNEKWMMHVEKRRYSLFHKSELIKELACVFTQKVDLKSPDKIVWIELIGKEAGIAIIRPSEIFSLYRAAQGA
ncbi:MAG: THUMP domain-containing protein [Thaumarchaeota archaeon]|nr:THUMP domain-containing protein [Nitrososphaerota archaeon]